MSAKNSFMTLYREKTGNEWGDGDFQKRPGKFYPLEIDYGQEDDNVANLSTLAAGSSSKLAPQIQDLIRIIFDVESMKKAMLEFEVSGCNEGRSGGQERKGREEGRGGRRAGEEGEGGGQGRKRREEGRGGQGRKGREEGRGERKEGGRRAG